MVKPNQQADGEIAPGTVIDGRYRVIRVIGQGGNGMVYEVEHTRTGRRLALKALLDQTGFARLEQEARAASLMKNGHTARIIDMEPGESIGPYMVMELLEGQSLRGLLDDAGQLPLELTVNIAMQVCECLHEAHGLGIIHRDLKPENVFLCASPWPGQYDVKVLDFGVMKVADVGGAIPKSSLTRTGSTVGTPYYMSLEQLRNSSAVDARADVYSLGVVLYECLSGRKPFQADTLGDLVYALCSGPPTPLSRLRPDLPPEVGDVVMRTLSANRDDRPASMLELALTLLPHANQAFSLWAAPFNKQAARAPMSSLTEAVPSLRSVPRAAPAPPSAAPLRPPVGTAKLEAAGYPPAPEPTPMMGLAHAATELAPNTAKGGAAAWSPRPAADEGGRRDTPTEMYVKGVHGPASDEEPAATGDRDTPTRAIELPVPPAPTQPVQRAPIAATMKSPGLVEEAPAPESAVGPRFGAPPLDLNAPPGAMQTIPISTHLMQMGAMQAQPVQAMPPGYDAGAPQPAGPPKPGWQVTLDRALLSIGRSGNDLGRWFRSQPQNTQIIIVIVAATAAILLIGLVVFLIVR